MIDLTGEIPRAASAEWWDFLPQFIDTFNKKLEDPKSITVQEYRKGMHTLDKTLVIFKNQKHRLNEKSAGDKTQEEIEELFDGLKALRIKALEFRRSKSKRAQILTPN